MSKLMNIDILCRQVYASHDAFVPPLCILCPAEQLPTYCTLQVAGLGPHSHGLSVPIVKQTRVISLISFAEVFLAMVGSSGTLFRCQHLSPRQATSVCE